MKGIHHCYHESPSETRVEWIDANNKRHRWNGYGMEGLGIIVVVIYVSYFNWIQQVLSAKGKKDTTGGIL